MAFPRSAALPYHSAAIAYCSEERAALARSRKSFTSASSAAAAAFARASAAARTDSAESLGFASRGISTGLAGLSLGGGVLGRGVAGTFLASAADGCDETAGSLLRARYPWAIVQIKAPASTADKPPNNHVPKFEDFGFAAVG